MKRLIEIDSLERHFPGFRLGPLSFALDTGRVLAVVGANGSGKTTLLRLIAGFTRPDAGTVETGERQIGFTSEATGFFERWTVAENLHFVSRCYSRWDDAYAMNLCKRLDLALDARVASLSKGGNTKLQLVAAIAPKPTILLLDEPTEGLDPIAREALFDILRQRQESAENGIVWCTHLLADIARLADEALFLAQGQLVAHHSAIELAERGSLPGIGMDDVALDILKGANDVALHPS